MNKSDIVEYMAGELGSSKAEARRLLDAHIEAISRHLASGNRVVIRGLGTFTVRATRRRRPPADPAAGALAPSTVLQVTFRTAEGLRAALRTPGPPA